MAVQLALCWTWSETPKTGFLAARLICVYIFQDGSDMESDQDVDDDDVDDEDILKDAGNIP